MGNHTVGISGPFEALTCIIFKCLRCLRNAENVVLNFPYSHSSSNGNKRVGEMEAGKEIIKL